ncbi:S8 family serine peptidase [Cytobacillus sp. FJAT-53684]|uniref:S8 family serine peptidase n=1 Tax=Cytobacillus mangrovibacter TaxID=3299024 RepID=A0ABW6JX65_9BACI
MHKLKYVSFILFLFILFPLTASADEETERVIIIFQNHVDHSVLEEYALEMHHTFEDLSAASITIRKGVKDQLKAEGNVLRIDPDPIVKTTSQLANWGYDHINANLSNASGWTGKGVKVGILDTGIRSKHPDLRITGGKSFVQYTSSYEDDQGHGTHVAGIIGALNNQIGVVGVAPDADLFAIKVLDDQGEGNQSDVVAGIEWAIQKKMDVINLSLTAPQGSILLDEALKRAYNEGILIVAATGNTLTNPSTSNMDVLFPARYPTVIAVGAVNNRNEKSSFSHYGDELEFVAPGEKILSTYSGIENHDYTYLNGTSMAAPFVTGIAALYKQAYPSLSHTEIRQLMQASALDLGVEGKDPLFGYGLIQAPKEIDPSEVTAFPDVAKESWYANEIDYLYDNQIVTGYSDGRFLPNALVTRAEAITMIGKALGYAGEHSHTSFKDVHESYYASGYIKNGTENEIIKGFPGDLFKPTLSITRGDVAVMLQRAFKYGTPTTSIFKDVEANKYYYEAVHSLKEANITTGYPDGTFKPQATISRAEFAVFLARALDEALREGE